MNENMKRLIVAFLFGLAVAIIAWVMLPGSSWQVLFSILFFGTVLEIVLERAEAGTATGRTLARFIPWGAGVLVFVALRIAGGYIFGLPIAMVYGNLFADIESFRSANQTLAIEVLFSALAVGLTCAAIKSERARKWLYAGACVAFVIVLYQAKAPEMSNAMSRFLNACGIITAQSVAEAANKLEKDVSPEFGLSTIETFLYEPQAGGVFSPIKGPSEEAFRLKSGVVVKFDGQSKITGGFVMMKIKLASKNGEFISNGPTAWVDSRAFNWEIEVGPDNKLVNPKLAKK
jgi:hypothetical protein